MPKDLPGFYWDAARNRYFPINSKPAAPPPFAEPQPPVSSSGDISRAPIRTSIWRKIELGKISIFDPQRAWLRHGILGSQYAGTTSVKEARVPVFGTIKNFISTTFDSGERYRLIGDSRGWIYSLRSSENEVEPVHGQWTVEMNISPESEISSINISDSYSLITSFGPLSKICLQRLDDPNCSVIISTTKLHDIRCSHFMNQNEVVIGAKQCAVQLLDVLNQPRTRFLKTYSDVFSIARQQNLVYAGARNGTIHRFDTRIPDDKGIKNLLLNKIRSTALHMQILHETHLLTSYMDGQLLMYDIRYIRQADPLLKFMGHSNTCTARLGIATDVENGFLFAAGQDRRIRGWSLWTGDPLVAPRTSMSRAPMPYNPLLALFEHPIETMQITREWSGPCLWAGHSDRLYQFNLAARDFV